jgi:hypothetical protein
MIQEELNVIKDIASEIVSTVEGAYGIGVEYDDIVEIIIELLIEKYHNNTLSIDKSDYSWYNNILNRKIDGC